MDIRRKGGGVPPDLCGYVYPYKLVVCGQELRYHQSGLCGDHEFHGVPGLRAMIERVAAVDHAQWVHWARSLLREEPGITSARRERWRSLFVSYGDLDEASKDVDREWARREIGGMWTP
jgi:hypothetical protein